MSLEAESELLYSSSEFAEALRLSEHLKPTASNLLRVSSKSSPEAARAAFAQWELRKKAHTKFPNASSLLFVREALEQASGVAAANYHASRFPNGEKVVDLTTGIGGDLIALARRGPALGFELDPDRAKMAQLNLATLGLEADVKREDGLAWLSTQSNAYVLADPARRESGRRLSDPDAFQPDPRAISELAQRQRLCVIKLSPMMQDTYLSELSPRLEFLSINGECKEVLALCGTEAVPGRVAVHVETGSILPVEEMPNTVNKADAFVYDTDPAAIRTHALGTLCRTLDLQPLGESNGYLTGSEALSSVWLKGYRVLHEGPGDLKTTRRKLVELDSGNPVWKQRLTNLDLVKMAATTKLNGSRTRIVICYPRDGRVVHLIAEPLP